jgi:hypothetical protein
MKDFMRVIPPTMVGYTRVIPIPEPEDLVTAEVKECGHGAVLHAGA